MPRHLLGSCRKVAQKDKANHKLFMENMRLATRNYGQVFSPVLTAHLKALTREHSFSLRTGDLLIADDLRR